MKRSCRILALCLAVLCVLPMTAAAAAPQTMKLDATWFDGDTGLYHHGLAQASMLLSLQAYNGNEKTVLQNYGFSNIKSSTGLKYGSLTLLNHTIATAEIGGRAVISVVFQDAKSGEQFQSIADFDGREHGFAAGANSEIAALLASAKAVLDSLADVITDNSCIWISGYGYGGGAAELLTAMLNGEEFELGDTACKYTTSADVRCYAFGTPAVSTQADGNDYNNIFVINNPEDLLVYLPGEEWGYRHFGQIIEMNTFHGVYQATPAQQEDIGYAYNNYCNESFYAFSTAHYAKNDDPKSFVSSKILSESRLSSLNKYYTQPFAVKICSSFDISGLLSEKNTVDDVRTTYALVSEVLSLLSESNSTDSDYILCMAAGTFLYGDGLFHDILVYAMTHALHITLSSNNVLGIMAAWKDIEPVINAVEAGTIPEMYELICAHTPSCYLAWVMTTNRLTELSGATTDALERWMEVSVSGENVSYAASIPGEDTLWLAVYNADGKMLKIESLGSGLIEDATIVPNAASAKLFLLDGSFCPVE